MTRRPPVFGAEPWHERWCHWDLWMCLVAVMDHDGDLGRLVAVMDHDGDLGRLGEAFVVEMGRLHGRDAAEAKWSHLTDMRRRLEDAGLSPGELVSNDHLDDRTLVAKARRKVAATDIEDRAKTEAMLETPRVRLERRALYGSWEAFPADPQPWYDRFRVAVEVKDTVTKGRTFKKVSTLAARLERLDRPGLAVAERLALYRAVHSALIELISRSDDSYGRSAASGKTSGRAIWGSTGVTAVSIPRRTSRTYASCSSGRSMGSDSAATPFHSSRSPTMRST